MDVGRQHISPKLNKTTSNSFTPLQKHMCKVSWKVEAEMLLFESWCQKEKKVRMVHYTSYPESQPQGQVSSVCYTCVVFNVHEGFVMEASFGLRPTCIKVSVSVEFHRNLYLIHP
jgi:hypothetical protein